MTAALSWRQMLHALELLFDGRQRYIRGLRLATDIRRSYQLLAQDTNELDDETRRAQLQILHTQNAQKVTALCRRNGATWIKMAQIMSCRPDLLPRAYIDELKALQNDAPAVPFEALEPVLIEELGSDWRSHFRDVDTVPVATASIAQVHRAITLDGEAVALKIQLPDVARLFKQDIVAFSLAIQVLAPFYRQVDLKMVARELFDLTRRELDFTGEAANLIAFSGLPHIDRIHFPRLLPALSRKRVLVTEWIPGARLREYLDGHSDQARELLTLLLDSYLQQIIRFGMYHADPHPGNFIVDDNGRITILDFGAIGRLSPEDAANYGALLLALFHKGNHDLQQVFSRAGFSGINEATFRDLSKIFLGGNKRDADYTELLAQAMDTLQQHRIVIPENFVLLARVLITIGGFMQTYKVRANLDAALMQHVASAVTGMQETPP